MGMRTTANFGFVKNIMIALARGIQEENRGIGTFV